MLSTSVQIAQGRGAPSEARVDVLTMRVSAEGICYFLDFSTPCVDVGHYLLSKHLAKNGHVDIVVDRASKLEMVTATLKSLRNAGFDKVGL
jgi:biopolymer transport protein ExbD